MKLEIQFVDISHNMSILMATLERESRRFSEFGGSNLDVGSEGKSRDIKDP